MKGADAMPTSAYDQDIISIVPQKFECFINTKL